MTWIYTYTHTHSHVYIYRRVGFIIMGTIYHTILNLKTGVNLEYNLTVEVRSQPEPRTTFN